MVDVHAGIDQGGPVIGSLCSGYGGLDLAVLSVLGGRIAWHADNDPDAVRVLRHHWPDVPNHGDIAAVDWRAVEPIDVLTAGYPCQPDSAAGKRLGKADERWIWPAVRDAIRDLGPRLAVLENVRGHLGRGFPGVLGDLADIGYDARWCCVQASAVGAPHRRERLFILAYPADAAGPGQGPRSATAARIRHATGPSGTSPADPASDGRHEGRTEPAGQLWRPDDATLSRDASADTNGSRPQGARPARPAGGGGTRLRVDTDRWGPWADAICRWERITGPAPNAVELGPRGNRRLNPAFSEWMMGLPRGWVTDLMTAQADPRRDPTRISRQAALRIIGNGVVPQQGAAALRWLLDQPP